MIFFGASPLLVEIKNAYWNILETLRWLEEDTWIAKLYQTFHWNQTINWSLHVLQERSDAVGCLSRRYGYFVLRYVWLALVMKDERGSSSGLVSRGLVITGLGTFALQLALVFHVLQLYHSDICHDHWMWNPTVSQLFQPHSLHVEPRGWVNGG